VRKLGSTERSVILLLYPLIVSFVVMALLLPGVYKPMELDEFGITAIVAALSLIGGALTIHSFRQGKATIIAPMQYSQIIWGVIFGTLFFNETPADTTLIGILIIISSGIFVVTRDGGTKVAQDELARRTTQIARINSFLTRRK